MNIFVFRSYQCCPVALNRKLITFINCIITNLVYSQVNAFRRKHKIHVWGTDIPDPVGTFSQLQTQYNLQADIIENIHRAGFVEPTQIQMQAVPVMLHVSTETAVQSVASLQCFQKGGGEWEHNLASRYTLIIHEVAQSCICQKTCFLLGLHPFITMY